MIDYEKDYYLIPKVLYTDPHYIFLSNKARLTYAIYVMSNEKLLKEANLMKMEMYI